MPIVPKVTQVADPKPEIGIADETAKFNLEVEDETVKIADEIQERQQESLKQLNEDIRNIKSEGKDTPEFIKESLSSVH